MQSRHRAIQTLKGARTLTTSAPRAAISPYKRATQVASTKLSKENAQRTQSTAAAATRAEPRARPSPAFNREDYHDVQPLKPYRQPEMDHSFVGMNGGQIFHEMMLRQNVKHICTIFFPCVRLPC
jgi:acetolactate synthase-1/2/3 large subunit